MSNISLAQEMTQITDFTNIDDAESEVHDMQHMVQTLNMDPAFVLESYGIEAKACWIRELQGEDEDSGDDPEE